MNILTVDELLSYLTALKESGSIKGTDFTLDAGLWGITHVARHDDGEVPYVTFESDGLDEAQAT